MSGKEIKVEIQKVLDTVPEGVLPDILDYLKQLQSLSKDKIDLSNQLQHIIREDLELLKRLAQ